MSKIKELLKSGHIHVATALGISIIVLAYFSKRIMPEPLEPIYLSITSLIMLGYEVVVGMKKHKKLEKSIYWVMAIIIATIVIIIFHIY